MAVKPLTYMNLSGESLREWVNYYKLDPETEMVVIYDDIDLDPGQIRIRKRAAQAVIMVLRALLPSLAHRTFTALRWEWEQSPGDGIWQIMCWGDFLRMRESQWIKPFVMQQMQWK